MCASFLGGIFLDAPKAYAATPTFTPPAQAQQIINNLAPIISAASIDNVSNSQANTLSVAPDGFLAKPLIAETNVTLNLPIKVVKPKVVAPVYKLAAKNEFPGNSFPYGYCTYYVAGKRAIPWRGNASAWLSGAQAYGFETGSTPRVGAIVVTSEGGKTGHVAMVDAVNDDGTITLSEMNYKGFGIISSRTIPASYGAIRGYIY